MEGRGVGGSRRPGTRAGLGPLPMPHGISQTGAPSKRVQLAHRRVPPGSTEPWTCSGFEITLERMDNSLELKCNPSK
uniref:Uncharacterized protein n=1 Tax=Capra hircus TaxID=9925 RepID=A0A8C2Y1I8_CAPHI